MKVRTTFSNVPIIGNIGRLSTVCIIVITAFLLNFVTVASSQVVSEIEVLPGYTAEIVAAPNPGFRYGDVAFSPNDGLMVSVVAYSRFPCDSYIAGISSDGIESRVADICIDAPHALAFSPLNNLIYFSEVAGYSDHVFTVPPGGGPSDVTLFASGFVVPLDMAFGPDGSLYVADHYYGTVHKFNAGGELTQIISGFTAGRTGYPVFWIGIAVDSSGILYVADGFASTVYKVTADGIASPFVTDILDPSAVSFSPEGDLFVADMSTNSVYSVSENGEINFFASGFDRPAALAFDDDGALYVFDSSFSIFKIYNANTYTVCKLSPLVKSLNLQKGIENSLVSKGDSACDLFNKGKINAVINKLEAFINEVEAQRGKKISDEDSDLLITAAQMIIDNI